MDNYIKLEHPVFEHSPARSHRTFLLGILAFVGGFGLFQRLHVVSVNLPHKFRAYGRYSSENTQHTIVSTPNAGMFEGWMKSGISWTHHKVEDATQDVVNTVHEVATQPDQFGSSLINDSHDLAAQVEKRVVVEGNRTVSIAEDTLSDVQHSCGVDKFRVSVRCENAMIIAALDLAGLPVSPHELRAAGFASASVDSLSSERIFARVLGNLMNSSLVHLPAAEKGELFVLDRFAAKGFVASAPMDVSGSVASGACTFCTVSGHLVDADVPSWIFQDRLGVPGISELLGDVGPVIDN